MLSIVHMYRIPHTVCCVPHPAGRYMYKGGKLVATSLDLYLALEYCDQGAGVGTWHVLGVLPHDLGLDSSGVWKTNST